MFPRMDTLTRPQRYGYILSLLLLSAGWLFLLAFVLDWSTAHWSRPVLAFQAAALVLALLLRLYVPTQRLLAYPLILAGSIYLWDTTLPPPSLPDGWPRVLVPSLVLFGLLIDYACVVQRVRQSHRHPASNDHHPVALNDAAQLLGIPVAELRRRIQKRRYVITVDAVGREYLSLDDLYALNHPNAPAWWHLYLWLLLMLGLSGLAMVVSIPTAWQTTVHIIWCLLIWGGMAVWVWVNWETLQDEDLANQRARARAADAVRTLPLTAVQQHFLDVMERHDRR